MGDRSNIAIVSTTEPETRVYLYGHWMGDDSIQHAIKGLRSGRADDASYLARIIFASMISDDDGGETGYGISTERYLDEHQLIVIDPYASTVHLEGWDDKVSTPKVSSTDFLEAAEGLADGEYGRLEELAKRINSFAHPLEASGGIGLAKH